MFFFHLLLFFCSFTGVIQWNYSRFKQICRFRQLLEPLSHWASKEFAYWRPRQIVPPQDSALDLLVGS